MFYKVVEELLHAGWILAGGIGFNGKMYLHALSRSKEDIWNIQLYMACVQILLLK
jgi:hypothetical protein